jgi:IS5 family transposase
LISRLYPKIEDLGRPLIDLAHMLRIDVTRECLGFLKKSIEDAIYESEAVRAFVVIGQVAR